MFPLPPYSQWILDVACQRASVEGQPSHPHIRDPQNFVTALLRILAIAIQEGEPVTRLGMENAMDAVFVLPELTPLLDDAALHQDQFAAFHLPACTQRFHPFWHQIVRPAWDQHADIRRACLATACQ